MQYLVYFKHSTHLYAALPVEAAYTSMSQLP